MTESRQRDWADILVARRRFKAPWCWGICWRRFSNSYRNEGAGPWGSAGLGEDVTGPRRKVRDC